MTNSYKLSIELFNLDAITNSSLSYFLNSNLCDFACLSTQKIDTNLFIIDAQRFTQSLEKTITSLRNSSQYVIVLYRIDLPKLECLDNIIFLEKPIDTKELIKQLKIIWEKVAKPETTIIQAQNKENTQQETTIKATKDSEHLHLFDAVSHSAKDTLQQRSKAQKYVGSNSDIHNNDANIEHIYLHKEKYLYAQLCQAIKLAKNKSSNIKIVIESKIIYLDNKTERFYYQLDKAELKYLRITPLTKESIQFFTTDVNFHQMQSSSKEKFIWKSALQASRGRIPSDANLHYPIQLIKWPNYPKLNVFRHTIQISAYWAAKQSSLLETARNLNIPQRYVFTLFTAMEALAYVKQSPLTTHITSIESHNKPSETKNKTKNQSLFAKILSHLFKN